MYLKLILLSSTVFAIKMPSDTMCVSKFLCVSAQKAGSVAEIYVERTRPGHLGLGFGPGVKMGKGEFVLIEFTAANKMISKECIMRGLVTPICKPNHDWIVLEFEFNPGNKGWKALITRNLAISRMIPLTFFKNRMVFSYSDSLMMEAHRAKNAAYGKFDVHFNSIEIQRR